MWRRAARCHTGWLFVITIGLWLASDKSCNADEYIDARREFLVQLSRLLLDDSGPVADASGWKGVLLLPPGMALSPQVTSFESLGSREQDNSQILGDSHLFDRALTIRNGVAFPKPRRLSETWEDVLRRSLPDTSCFDKDFLVEDPESAGMDAQPRAALEGSAESCCAGDRALTKPAAEMDADLARVLAAWPGLPPHIRAAILALVTGAVRISMNVRA
jgi:hypothetical protein